jgi:cytochrome c
MRKRFALALAGATLLAGAAFAESPGLGAKITEADIKPWDISILGDGSNLPPGSGTPQQGAKLYVEKGCGACHGEAGKGGNAAPLVGAPPKDRIDAPKTIVNFWGYPTTVFDFIRRAMPWPQPRTLTDDETYALTAYIFAQNKLIGENDVLNAESLRKVQLPNRDNFILKFPDRIGS